MRRNHVWPAEASPRLLTYASAIRQAHTFQRTRLRAAWLGIKGPLMITAAAAMVVISSLFGSLAVWVTMFLMFPLAAAGMDNLYRTYAEWRDEQ